jgi:2-polyprenyl-3-methyl-5-hydroxy-6-metoxy-1,4-benzoquinol methylase
VGVDVSQHVCDKLSKKYPEHKFFQRDFNQDALALTGCFDTILMAAVLEHLKAPQLLFRQLGSYLLPGGQIVITTPTPLGGLVHTVGSKVGMFYTEAANEHEAFYTRASLTSLAEGSGLMMISYKTFLLFGNQLAIFVTKNDQDTGGAS